MFKENEEWSQIIRFQIIKFLKKIKHLKQSMDELQGDRCKVRTVTDNI